MLVKIYYLCVCVCVFSYVQLFETQWTSAQQSPLSMIFSRQEYWSGLPFPTMSNFQKGKIKMRHAKDQEI